MCKRLRRSTKLHGNRAESGGELSEMIEECFCFKCGLPDDTANMEELHVPDGDGGFYSIEFHAHPMCHARRQGLEGNYNVGRLIPVLHKLIDEIEAKRKMRA